MTTTMKRLAAYACVAGSIFAAGSTASAADFDLNALIEAAKGEPPMPDGLVGVWQGRLYAIGKGVLAVFDLRDPTAPKLMGRLEDDRIVRGWHMAGRAALVRGYLYNPSGTTRLSKSSGGARPRCSGPAPSHRRCWGQRARLCRFVSARSQSG